MNLKDEAGKVVNVIHRSLVKATGGRVGGSIMGMPAVILHHTGRKTGQARTTMLTTPIVDLAFNSAHRTAGGPPLEPR